MADLEHASWTVVIPVKRTAIAKSRLAADYPSTARTSRWPSRSTLLPPRCVPPGPGVVVITDDAVVADEVTALGGARRPGRT